MAGYRRAHRSALLNLTIVSLAAVTAMLWIARPVLPNPQRLMLHLRPPSQAGRPASHRPPAGPAGRNQANSAVLGASTTTATAAATETPVATATPQATPQAAPSDETPDPEAPQPDQQTPAPAAGEPSDSTDSAPEDVSVAPAPGPPSLPPPPSPRLVRARAAQTAYLRTEPTVAALIVGSLPPGTVVTVVGCANGCNWLLVQLPGGGQAWSESYFYSLLGSLAGL